MREAVNKIAFAALGLIFIVIALVGGGFLLWLILTTTWNNFRDLSKEVQLAIAVPVVGLITGLLTIAYTKVREKQIQIDANNASRKGKIYSKFTNELLDIVAHPELGKDDEYTHKMRLSFMKNAILWADADVLDAYHKFRINSQNNLNTEQALWDSAHLFLAFRKDLGLKNKKRFKRLKITEHTINEILYQQEELAEFYKIFPKKKQ